MKIGLIVPTRGDRPQFLKHAHFLISEQTLQPDEVVVVDYPPKSNTIDLVDRYKAGYAECINRGCDLIFCWEDDDWYHRQYLEFMFNAWSDSSKPNLFGLSTTIYYHIFWRKYIILNHDNRASMMATVIHRNLDVKWCDPNIPYLDYHLWRRTPDFQKLALTWKQPLCIGIKHNIGMAGGSGHSKERIYEKAFSDESMDWLRCRVDPDSFEFYKTLSDGKRKA